jgi:hypothetical protein
MLARIARPLLFVRAKGIGALGDLEQAGIDVHANALGEFGRAREQHLVERGVGLLVLALLHEVDGSLIAGDGGGSAAVGGNGHGAGEGTGVTLLGADGCGLGLGHRVIPGAAL